MSQIHQTPEARMLELAEEIVSIIRAMGLPWDIARGFLRDIVDSAQHEEEHPEDYDCGSEDEETGVFQFPAPFCRLDDERGAA